MRYKLNKNDFLNIGIENDYSLDLSTVVNFNAKEKVLWECLKCGKKTIITYDLIKRGRKCECCRKRNRKFTQLEARQIFLDNGFEMIGNYINANINVVVKCNVCNYVHNKKMGNINKKCLKCSGCKKYTIDEVKNELNKRNITLLSNYKNARKHITVRCDICGYEWKVLFGAVVRRNSSGCHKCELNRRLLCKKRSFYCIGKKEDEIVFPMLKKIFKKYNIEPQYLVQVQKKISFPFSIDFVIKELGLAIEYDEDHHKSKSNIKKDNKRQKLIEDETGFVFLRLNEEEIDTGIEYIEKKVFNFLEHKHLI